MKLPRQRVLIEFGRRRPTYPGGGGELKVFADHPNREIEAAGDLAERKSGIVFEPKNVFDLTHGKPVGWHLSSPP